MRKILAFLLAFAMMLSLATVFASAAPYVPPAFAWKDFGQENYYVYEVKDGYAKPRADGFVTDSDNYGEPVATYYFRYCTTADRVVYGDDLQPLPEYKLRNDGENAGTYYVYPTSYSSDEVWSSIASIETNADGAYVMTGYYEVTNPSATGTYYYYNVGAGTFSTAYPKGGKYYGAWTTEDAKGTYIYDSSGNPVYEYELIREKPADWDTALNAAGTKSSTYYERVYSSESFNHAYSTVTTSWTVTLTGYEEENKAAVISALRSAAGMTQAKAEAALENLPMDLKSGMAKADADTLGDALTAAGAAVNKTSQMPKFRANTYYVYAYDYTLLKEQPEDWDTAVGSSASTSYYMNQAGKKVLVPLEDDAMPPFEANTYYSRARRQRYADKLYASTEGNTNQAATVTRMKNAHAVLPEEVRVYARYDANYVYEAVEVVEPAHRYLDYNADLRYGSEPSSIMGMLMMNNSFALGLNKPLSGGTARVVKSTLIRTRISASTTINTATTDSTVVPGTTAAVEAYRAAVVRKFGNYEGTSISDVMKAGSNYNVTRQTHDQTRVTLVPSSDDSFGEEEDVTSGTYGTTTYEWKLPWSVLNDNYNPYRDSTAVSHMLAAMQMFQLDNNVGRAAYLLNLSLPRDTRQLPGSLSGGTSGNYSKTIYAMRFPSNTGLPAGEYRFHWANYASGYNIVAKEYYVSDYFAVSNLTAAAGSAYTPSIWYFAGQEPEEGYVKPEVLGAQIRVDDSEGQGMRFKIKVPNGSAEEIDEVGAIFAPTEVSAGVELVYGMDEISYNATHNPELYGIVPTKDADGNLTGKYHWINLCTDTDTYFNASTTPGDANSFYAQDVLGGKPSGLYAVRTLKCDISTPYETNRTYKYSAYTCEVTDLHDDFDDYFTYYTVRPYIKYADGTIVYGEYEYKSVYYVACWSIEEFVDSINGTVGSEVANRYTMDEMPFVAATDADGNTLKDEKGNTVYVTRDSTQSSMSQYYGSADHSLYIPEERLVVFRTNAVRVLNRVNRLSYRVKDYDSFPDDFKGFVDQYVEMYEYVWKCIEECEDKVYLIDQRT